MEHSTAQHPQFAPPPTTSPAQEMQPSPAKKSLWDKAVKQSKIWFEKVGEPVNKLSNKLGAEAFWPTSLDKESDKAARILRSFCIDGFASQPTEQKPGTGDRLKRALDRIPPEVIKNAKGLAVFTVMRMGLHWSGAGGSGIIISRLPNGQWSAPSGILIHTIGWGFVAGADIYDCVCVINDEKGMDGFTRVRGTIGGEISAAVGPLGAGGMVDSEVFKRQAAVWTYIKSKGLYLGVQVDGTVIVERHVENERFYQVEKVRNKQILAGQVQPPSGSVTQLWETLQAIDGHSYDPTKLPSADARPPGDLEVTTPEQESYKEYEEFAGQEPRMDVKQ